MTRPRDPDDPYDPYAREGVDDDLDDPGYGAGSWDAPDRPVEPRYRDRPGRAGRVAGAPTRPADHRTATARAPSWSLGPTAARRSRPRVGRLVGAGVAVLAVVALLVLGFVTPGWFVTRVFSATAVQAGVAKILTDAYATDGVADVRCPERVPVVPGTTFTCDAAVDDDPVKIPVRVTDAKGAYEVGRPT